MNSEKYPMFRSLSVGPAIKSWIENVATAMVGEKRLTGNTAAKLFWESGNFEKYTLIDWDPLSGITVESGVVTLVPEGGVCCQVEATGEEGASVVVGVGVILAPV